MNSMLRLIPNNTASKRTKDRIKQHGPLFTVVGDGNPTCFNGRKSILVVTNNWRGWIPCNELETLNPKPRVTMATQMTELEILKETRKFYEEDTNRRSLSAGGTCFYNQNGKQCAVGRCLLSEWQDDSKLSLLAKYMLDINEKLKPQYRGYSNDFWYDLQIFHDNSEYWDDKGLTQMGIERYDLLVEKYTKN